MSQRSREMSEANRVAAVRDLNPDYAFVDEWARLPAGWKIGDVGGVAVDERDRVYVFHRGPAPLLVFTADGELVDAWGDGVFESPHGLHLGGDGCVYCTDSGDHTVRKFDRRGRLLQVYGTPGEASGVLSGRPFNRCTHCALAPNGDLFVSDGYRNACVHCFAADGRLKHSWGASGSLAGEFYVPHNIVCDRDGTVYVADRENHRVQCFDGEGRVRALWHELHRPMALCLARMDPDDPEESMLVGEAGPSWNTSFSGLGPRLSIVGRDGTLRGRFGDRGYGHAPDRFMAPHGVAVDSRGDIYVGEVAHAAWPSVYPNEALPTDLRTLRKLRRTRP